METPNKHPYLIFAAIILIGLIAVGIIAWQKENKNLSEPASIKTETAE